MTCDEHDWEKVGAIWWGEVSKPQYSTLYRCTRCKLPRTGDGTEETDG